MLLPLQRLNTLFPSPRCLSRTTTVAASSTNPAGRLFSPSDLTTFAESPWVSWLERLAREVPSHPLVAEADAPDAFLQLLGRKGDESEAAVLQALRAQGRTVVDLSSVRGTYEERVAATAAAMADGPDVIYQAPLSSGGFFGIADFLVRVDGSTTTSQQQNEYTVWDAKLARSPRPSQALQLCCYAEMLTNLQGTPVERVGLILGATPLILRVASHAALYRRTRDRFLEAQSRFDATLEPPEPPEPRAPAGRWSGLADKELLTRDDLRLVARLSKRQAARLRAAGVTTATELAALGDKPPDIAGVPPPVLRRLRRQAQLQIRARSNPTVSPPFELVRGACAPSIGLGLLPTPDPADGFFDLEGFPFATLPAVAGGKQLPDLVALSQREDHRGEDAGSPPPPPPPALEGGGREYLWGMSTRPDSSNGETEYIAWWAHSASEERDAFVSCVDWMLQRKADHPNMHIYHYGAYELSVLRRLAGRYGVREEEVDQILRSGMLIDLYDVVRHSLLIGEPRYSIKNVEKLYRASVKRETEVAKGDQSVAVYADWLDNPDGGNEDSEMLMALAEYNRDDCESTRQLADWLWEVRVGRCPKLQRMQKAAAVVDEEETTDEEEPVIIDEVEAEVIRLEEALAEESGWPSSSALSDEGARSTLSGMLRYHKREAKPQWWRRYDWLASPPNELVTDARTLGGLLRTEREPYKSAPRKRRLAYEYSFNPQQECNIPPGGDVVIRDDDTFVDGGDDADDDDGNEVLVDFGETLSGTLLELDRKTGVAVIECGTPPPSSLSALPNEFVDGAPVARALRESAAIMLAEPHTRTALGEVLARNPPRLGDGVLALPELTSRGGDAASAAVEAVLALNSSYLCVQGPPGTGKTYTAAKCISALVSEGRRVGVMAVSHRAISNLMAKALSMIGADEESCGVLKIGGSVNDLTELQKVAGESSAGGSLLSVRQLRGASSLKKDGLRPDELLIGGTAWAFSNSELVNELDVLFVDEAGQLPLAQLAGASRSASSIVLLGDQMQLPAPSEGHHPGESGASCLDYLLRGAETVPPDMGIFLPITYRLHPSLCKLVSELSYRGLLKPHPSTSQRSIELATGGKTSSSSLLAPRLTNGVQFVGIEHEGNSQSSIEEVEAIQTICKQLLDDGIFIDGDEAKRPITPSDILVVAPYNLQVRALEAALPDSVRVGTVDRFQGQEAPIVLLSLCHSDFGSTSSNDAKEGGTDGDASAGGGSERGLSFVLNPNRINVALSRAQCLAVVVGSPKLADANPKTLQQQRELNVLCRIIEE